MSNFESLDDRIDWPSFYGRHGIDRMPARATGDVAVACPFEKHTNKQAFSVNTKTGQWQCFACGTNGNAYDYLAARGMSKEAAVDEVRRAAGLPPKGEGGDVVAMTRAKMTVEKYAAEKQLDVAFLKELGLRNPAGKGTGMAVPYLDADGVEVATRYRQVSTPSSPKFLWKKGSRVHLYGLWRMQLVHACIRERVILVEGESDCHTMWQRGYEEVLGAPGSNTFRSEWAQYLPTDRPVYYLREPGMSGDQFASTLCKKLTEAGWAGKLHEISLHEQGVKDPSDLHIKDGARFDAIFEAAITAARPVDHLAATLKPEDIVPGFPPLRQPDGFRLDAEKGVMSVTKEGVWFNVCPVPVGLARRLRSVDTGEEKVEVLFRRDGQLHSVATERTTISTVRGIAQLANRSLPVNDGNARHLMLYLAALEGANLETLPLHRCIDRMGWVDSKTFLPGVAGDDVFLDTPPGSGTGQMAQAYHESGDAARWLELAGHVRDNHPTARLMLAASFAAPLLSRLQQRVFLLHVWGPSRGGKTAALKLALSAWGEPDGLLANFNGTKVGLEAMASFHSDLPLGIDEKQVAGDRQNFIEALVYTLGLGKGKARGAKTGGLQAFRSWRSIVLTTGEESITNDSSHGGVSTRAVEVYGQPIEHDEELARRLHTESGKHYGHAGPEFIRRLLKHESLQIDWEAMLAAMETDATDNVTSHVASVAVLALADYLTSVWLWNVPSDAAWARSVSLGQGTLAALEKATDVDYAERARDALDGWLTRHAEKFTLDPRNERFGIMDLDELRPEKATAWIIPGVFNDAMKDAGLNPRRVLTDFAERGWIHVEVDGPTRRHKVRTNVMGTRQRLIGFLRTRPNEIVEQLSPACNPGDVF